MATLGAGLTLIGSSRHIPAMTHLGIAFLTVGLTLALLGMLDVGVRGRRHWF